MRIRRRLSKEFLRHEFWGTKWLCFLCLGMWFLCTLQTYEYTELLCKYLWFWSMLTMRSKNYPEACLMLDRDAVVSVSPISLAAEMSEYYNLIQFNSIVHRNCSPSGSLSGFTSKHISAFFPCYHMWPHTHAHADSCLFLISQKPNSSFIKTKINMILLYLLCL